MRAYAQGPYDTALLFASLGLSLIVAQYVVLPYLQRRHAPRRLLQIAFTCLIISYLLTSFCRSFHQVIAVTALQMGANAIAYAETSTQLTASVEKPDLGKATGLAAMVTWGMHFIVPVYASHLVTSWHYTYAFYSSALMSAGTLAFITYSAKHVDARVESILPAFGMA
uniref:Major facilitator superfamily (MFS) profile domain-containing protein n=1 Tax=Plectus sambesii TaxID=2011161 RepID=A0A914XGH1_9BILA